MSTISDVVVPENFTTYVVDESTKRSAFLISGAATNNALLESKASMGGTTIQVPFWNDLGDDEANISNDDVNSNATPLKVTANKQVARISQLNNGWYTSDLASELAGSNASDMVKSRVTGYWTRQFNKRLVASAVGVYASNVANDGGDMVSEADAFTSELFTSAIMTMGENFDKLKAMSVHPLVYKMIVDQAEASGSPVTYQFFEQLNVRIPIYRGLALIVDNQMPTDGTGIDTFYTSVLYAEGSFGMAAGTPMNPLGIERGEASGNGGGSESLWSRTSPIIHPQGFKWLEASVVGLSPTIAELKLAANWERVLQRENCPMAFMRHKLPA
jgi:hypothetical protein